MPHIQFFKSISKKDVSSAGGKGASLGEMTRLRIGYAGRADYNNPVPPGFVVLASAFDRFLEETDLNVEIKAQLKKVKMDDTNYVDRASNVIRDAIHDRPMPKDLEKEILSAFDQLGICRRSPIKSGMIVAVRSSATAEDSQVASWAGELETYLNIDKDNLVEAVKKCWSSLFTPRAIFYRHEKKLIDHYVSVAVVVQEMVQSEISGIAFTVHPVTEDFNQMIIEAGLGLGEAIVSGQITPDSYVVEKKGFAILDINIGEQTRKLIKAKKQKSPPKADLPQGDIKTTKPASVRLAQAGLQCDKEETNEWVECDKEGGKQKLTGKQIVELAKLCKKIEDHYGFPCDIEWAFANKKFYITQSRPITTLKK